jgi:alditol oxidase
MGFTPSAGQEIQSEYIVPRGHALGAIDAVRGLAGAVRPVLQVSETRTVAADRLWMSPQYATDTVAIHFTWKREPEAVARVVVELEAALAPFEARPHWGSAGRGARRARRSRPGAFRNAWLERRVLGAG